MLDNIKDKLKSLFGEEGEGKENKTQKKISIFKDIEKNFTRVNKLFGKSEDVVVRRFTIGQSNIKAFLLHIDGLIDKKLLNDDILQPLMSHTRQMSPGADDISDIYKWIKEKVIAINDVGETDDFTKSIDAALSGDTTIFIDGYDQALLASTRGWAARGIEKPTTETAIRGPKEAFTETLRTNTSLLRRKVKSTNLKFESMMIGEVTKTQVCLGYIKGIVKPEVVKEVKKRLKDIKVDSILDVGYIEEFIEDAPLSPLPTIYRTERPDGVAGKLLEGKVAILVDGSPAALTLPTVFMNFLLTSEDYYQRTFVSTMARWFRFISLGITLLLPALYVSVVSYHQEMLPTQLTIKIAAERAGIPFPAVVEAVIMGLVFELLREAGTRMPRPLGQAISIVGALILGEAAVTAGLTSTPMVIVAAVTGIGLFAIPSVDLAFTLIAFRILITVLAGLMGLFGVLVGVLTMVIHMASLRSFGVPYLSPLAPGDYSDFKEETLIRAPWWAINTRPKFITKNRIRQEINQQPQDPEDDEKDLLYDQEGD